MDRHSDRKGPISNGVATDRGPNPRFANASRATILETDSGPGKGGVGSLGLG